MSPASVSAPRRAAVALAFTGALSLGVLGTTSALNTVAPAQAATVVGAATQGASESTAADHLTITLSPGNPKPFETTKGSIEGVTVRLRPLLGIDPLSEQDIKKISDTGLDTVLKWDTGEEITAVTDANGTVKFSGLKKSVYIVDSQAPDNSYRQLSPFLVAMPYHALNGDESTPAGVIVAKTHLTPPTPTETNPNRWSETETPGTSTKPSTTKRVPPTPATETPETLRPPTPGKTTTPATPPTSAVPPGGDTPPNPHKGIDVSTPLGHLAMTGAQVVGLFIGSLVLIGGGLLLLLASRRKQES